MTNPNNIVEIEEGNRRFRRTEEQVERHDPQYGLDPKRVRRVWSDGKGVHYSVGGEEMPKEQYMAKIRGR